MYDPISLIANRKVINSFFCYLKDLMLTSRNFILYFSKELVKRSLPDLKKFLFENGDFVQLKILQWDMFLVLETKT